MTDYSERRCEKASAPEDRLTTLNDDLLISIFSFLPIKQRVALSAVCTCFLGLLPSIPRLDTFRLDVGSPSGGVDVHQEFTFPRALIQQCHVVFCSASELSKPHEQLLVEGLVESGVQDLILKTFGIGYFYVSGRENCGFFGIKSLRSLFLDRIRVSKYDDRRPVSLLGCAFLTSLKMKFSVFDDTFLRNLFVSCPFLETLQIIRCCALGNGPNVTNNKLRYYSASIKHLFHLQINMLHFTTVDICAPQLESLVVDVFTTLRIEAPKARNASFLLRIERPADPPGALMKLLFGASFPRQAAWLMLNSSKSPNILAAENEENGIDKFKESDMIFKLDFNLKDQSSTTILTKLLKKCNDYKTKFDIRLDSTRIESGTETARHDKQLLYSPTRLELINLQMTMPERVFREFISNPKKMKDFQDAGLKMLRRRTNKDQFKDILASEDSLFQVSSSIANGIEMKF